MPELNNDAHMQYTHTHWLQTRFDLINCDTCNRIRNQSSDNILSAQSQQQQQQQGVESDRAEQMGEGGVGGDGNKMGAFEFMCAF